MVFYFGLVDFSRRAVIGLDFRVPFQVDLGCLISRRAVRW